jgi:triosephosphate isomerase
MAAEAGVGWGLAGHSERRSEFGDDDADVAGKLRRLLDAGLKPILCVGETLEERTADRLEEVLQRQIKAVLGGLGGRTWSSPVLAYEPVWAIGTGETASAADASEAHAIVREVLREAPGDAVRGVILYGGSVNPDNIDALLEERGVDGVLVGGASLEPASFARICLGKTDDGRSDPQLL